MTEEIICFDPRDPHQREDDPSTWKPTRNPALVASREVAGRGYGEMHWQNVAALADECDQPAGPAYVRVGVDLGTVHEPECARKVLDAIEAAIGDGSVDTSSVGKYHLPN